MTHYDVFNGDADGICALHQLRLAEPRDSVLITGVKRDISLAKQIKPDSAASVTILDVAFDKNREAVQALLDSDVTVDYFDHHFPGDVPEHKNLTTHIDTDANICTGLIVNRYLQHAHPAWAVTAAFGDNLLDAANTAATALNLSGDQHALLEQLGTLLNYNGYGSTLDDLFFPPADLYQRVRPYASPFDFISDNDAFTTLAEGYASDMSRAQSTEAVLKNEHVAVFMFPQEAFARRVSGVYANQLAQQNPGRAHAMLSSLPGDGYLVSVRAPLDNKTGADELCRQFETGGGRKAAAGINFLPASEVDAFNKAFSEQYSR